MNLLERAKNLQDTLSAVSRIKEEETTAKLLRDRQLQLAELRQRIHEARQKLEVLRPHGITAPTPTASAELTERLTECRAALVQTSRIEDTLWRPMVKSLQGLSTRHDNTVKGAIKQRFDTVDALKPQSVAALAEALGRLQEFQSIQAERSSLVSTEWETKGVKDLALLLKSAANLLDRWERIRFDDIPAAVEKFLEAARRSGAPIDRFTDEVKAWLEKNGLLSRVRISLAKE
ncbi:hypothetical protein OV208_30210 [Corallococcus sp. bb12-1]|uniref:hypothetical protein n=1 Tax=Corallococcus sp. bb12-1 TaxID=2996784 RepID=UPI00227167B5|nr:hypothetical protein [Corallococcus sp. bb12-1]MCY1045628.1 hypothetical protein [Corallococcus sp. bb12-1]